MIDIRDVDIEETRLEGMLHRMVADFDIPVEIGTGIHRENGDFVGLAVRDHRTLGF